MKVLFLDQFSELGGAQRCLLDLLPGVEERGWSFGAALPEGGPLLDMVRARGAGVREIPCGPYRSGSKSVSDSVRFLRDLRLQVKLLRTEQADLVYVNGPRLLAAGAIAFGGRAPVLFHAHSLVPAGPQAWLANWGVDRSDAMVMACTRAVAPRVRSEKLRMVANGTPDIGFRERAFSRWRIGIIGRIGPEKGQAEFLRAAAIVAAEFSDVRFIVCGAPDLFSARYMEAVQKLAAGLPVDFLGWREDVGAVLAGLDVLVIASAAEGMPRVLLEAFSAGVPVIAFPVGGIPEVITDGETGFLVQDRSATALAARIREVMMVGAPLLQRVASNARREWERHYTVERYRENVTELMDRLVSDWRAERGIETPPARR